MTGHNNIGTQLMGNVIFNKLDSNNDGQLNGTDAFGLFNNQGGNYSQFGGNLAQMGGQFAQFGANPASYGGGYGGGYAGHSGYANYGGGYGGYH